MREYNNLLLKTNELGILVVEIDLGTDIPCGKCIGNTIFINNRVGIKEKRCILAEELGHYYLTVGNITDQSDIRNAKQELKARRYGYKLLIEPDDIIHAVKMGCLNRYDLAEYLNVTDDFFQELINDYKKQYGVGVLVGNYYLQLEPSFGVIKDFGDLFNYKK